MLTQPTLRRPTLSKVRRVPPPNRWREPTAYDLFDATGRYLGYLRVPENGTLLYARGDHAWGTMRDSLDVPTVVRFRFQPALSERARLVASEVQP